MTQKQFLQLFFLLVLCTANNIVNVPIYSINTKEAEIAFKKLFCTYCGREQADVCRKNIDRISSLPQTGHFNLSASPIVNNPYNITTIKVYTVETNQTYRFPNKRLVKKNHSSLLYFPTNGTSVRGVVVYFHAATLGKWNGPSANGKEYQALAGLYNSQGFAVVIPDLLGYRSDADPHPFLLYPQVSVRSAVSTLNELAPFFKGFGSASLPIYAVGYGQGGSYALWFSKCVSFPDSCPSFTLSDLPEHSLSLSTFYRFKAASSLEGALDLSRVMYDFLTKNVGVATRGNDFAIQDQMALNLAKGPLTVALLDSYLLYSLSKEGQLSDYIAKDFFNMRCSGPLNQTLCKIGGKIVNVSAALGSNGNEAALLMAFGLSSLAQTYDGERTPYLGSSFRFYLRGENNSAFSLASRSIVANQSFYNTLIDATIVDYAQRAPTPTFVWTLTYDSVIPGNNTRNFAQAGRGNRFVSSYYFDNDQYEICDLALTPVPVDHTHAELLANIFALNFIQQNK